MRSAGTLTLETRNAVLDEDYAEQYEEVTPGEYVLLAVADTGTGMPPGIPQRVFEPFFTTKEVGQGSGLGLSMVYGFVKQSGGHVSIYSRVGQGTCVKLYLPRAPSSPVRPEEGPPDVFPEDLGNKVVLVVEDEARLRRVAVKMLDRLGLQSLQAETAKDALQSNTAWPRSRRQLRTIRSSHDRLDQLSGGGADPAGLVGFRAGVHRNRGCWSCARLAPALVPTNL